MNVVVLGGGDSPERDVSLRSAQAVSAALRQAGYQVLELDPKTRISYRISQKVQLFFRY